MRNQRRPASQVTPRSEDRGLFKRNLRQIPVELLAAIDRNNRGDLLIRGIVNPETAVEVLIAGRRVAAAFPLVERLMQMRTQANRVAANRGPGTGSGAAHGQKVRSLRLPVVVSGGWRLRFVPDPSGWEIKTYQLIAAQWSFEDVRGRQVTQGLPLAPQQDPAFGQYSAVVQPGKPVEEVTQLHMRL